MQSIIQMTASFPPGVSARALFLSLIALSCSPSLSSFLSFSPPSVTVPRLLPFVFHPLDSISFFPLPSISLSLSLSLSLFRRRGSAQLRRPWDKRLHFLIFKCAQTSYRAIVCLTEALRRGFRADKPLQPPQPSMHASPASTARQAPPFAPPPPFAPSPLLPPAWKCKSPPWEQRLWNRKGRASFFLAAPLTTKFLHPPPHVAGPRRRRFRGEY